MRLKREARLVLIDAADEEHLLRKKPDQRTATPRQSKRASEAISPPAGSHQSEALSKPTCSAKRRSEQSPPLGRLFEGLPLVLDRAPEAEGAT